MAINVINVGFFKHSLGGTYVDADIHRNFMKLLT